MSVRRRYAKQPLKSGRYRVKSGWETYRGFTLDPSKFIGRSHGPDTWAVDIYSHGGGPGRHEGDTHGATLEEAMGKAKRLVDAMQGD